MQVKITFGQVIGISSFSNQTIQDIETPPNLRQKSKGIHVVFSVGQVKIKTKQVCQALPNVRAILLANFV